MYATTNLMSAHTMRTDELWPSGDSGYDVDGSGIFHTNLGVWDGGSVLTSHQEFGDRVVLGNPDVAVHDHATHVAGTMIAAGVNSDAHGMSPLAMISSYDWEDDNAELTEAASVGMLVTNHSYVHIAGWFYGFDEPEWYWFGDPSVSSGEDYYWGFYSNSSRNIDEIAYNAPYMLMCWAAGNDRGLGPEAGSEHYVWDPQSSDWVLSSDEREVDGGPDGYDCIAHTGMAKNIITVGAVEKIEGGYQYPWDVHMSSFSGWGPSDDGRIKPDLVAPGVQITSTVGTGPDEYATWSGTSMATPSLSGTVALLQNHYKNTHSGLSPKSYAMKAILIHSASEAGFTDGPDYGFGWGLINARAAAEIITSHSENENNIFSENLLNNETDEYFFTVDGDSPIKATLVWNDLPGEVIEASLDSIHPVLVNDLDMIVSDDSQNAVYMPWMLDVENPGSTATRGDNTVDNVEQVVVDETYTAGTELRIAISHKGTLQEGSQNYALVVTGMSYQGSDVEDGQKETIPSSFTLSEAYPNPFNPSTKLTISIPMSGNVDIAVYDISGREIMKERKHFDAGVNSYLINAESLKMSSGIYLIQARYNNHLENRKITFIK